MAIEILKAVQFWFLACFSGGRKDNCAWSSAFSGRKWRLDQTNAFAHNSTSINFGEHLIYSAYFSLFPSNPSTADMLTQSSFHDTFIYYYFIIYIIFYYIKQVLNKDNEWIMMLKYDISNPCRLYYNLQAPFCPNQIKNINKLLVRIIQWIKFLFFQKLNL